MLKKEQKRVEKNYAKDVKDVCKSYFEEDSTNLNSLINLKELINSRLKKNQDE